MNILPDWNKVRGDWWCQVLLLQARNPKVDKKLIKAIQREGFMPLYDYKCDQCGIIIEVLHKVDDSLDGKQCCMNSGRLDCGGRLHKLLTAPGGFIGNPTPKYHGN